jgi:hypothetical protein
VLVDVDTVADLAALRARQGLPAVLGAAPE